MQKDIYGKRSEIIATNFLKENNVETLELCDVLDIKTIDENNHEVICKYKGKEVTYKSKYVIVAPGRTGAKWVGELAEKYNGGKPIKVVANLPYYITTPIIMHILENDIGAQSLCIMIQKEVAERIAETPGTKTYGILSVLLQAWYDIEYLFTVGEGAFNPPPKVKSAVIRLVRNSRTDLGCDEALFKTVVKTGFNQRRKTLRNSLKPLIRAKADRCGWSEEQLAEFIADPVFELRPERLSVEDFISLTLKLA